MKKGNTIVNQEADTVFGDPSCVCHLSCLFSFKFEKNVKLMIKQQSKKKI